ncbi:Delta(24)-sterol C-methyltransferase [Coemansia interrupta]|uniref:Sterol 24-C-methyltransferase n=1 Tax=Coemansia interrupta TaxID=1126814 RepID=A0A9W8HJU9_9FUNG|nr:Delta(24)-sterol C-methyltransferase [Coemansia interrupta]
MSSSKILEPTSELSKALHTKVVADSSATSLVNRLRGKDKDLQTQSVNTYEQFWNGAENNNEKSRASMYKTLTNTYYNLATDFYEYGWGESFHFARRSIDESLRESIRRHEHILFSAAQIKSGMKVLDVGCGVGGPARECVRLTGAHVTGLNNNDYQIQRANIYAAKNKQENHSTFVKGDFMHMPFEDNSFDAAYAIEATCHAPVLKDVYSEMYRVVKPGGYFAIYEWCLTDSFDDNSEYHKKLARDIELGDGIGKLFSTKVALQAAKDAGFEIETAIDLAHETTVSNDIPWYDGLDVRMIDFTNIQAFARSQIGRLFTSNAVKLLEKVGIAPAGTYKVQDILATGADALVAGGKEKVFTPMYLIVGRKPLN